jgi:glyoxylase-like metal-dependent hydrolase (beta-lactamase superfamily II)
MKQIYPDASVVAGEADCKTGDGGQLVINEILIDIPISSTSGSVSRPVSGIRAVALPGHTRGSVIYISEKNDVTFVGDLVIGHKEYLARPLRRANEDDALYLASLRLLSNLTSDIGAPGHGYVVNRDFRARVTELAALPRRGFNLVRLIRGLFAFARLRFNR